MSTPERPETNAPLAGWPARSALSDDFSSGETKYRQQTHAFSLAAAPPQFFKCVAYSTAAIVRASSHAEIITAPREQLSNA
jgi:hypothetical protein